MLAEDVIGAVMRRKRLYLLTDTTFASKAISQIFSTCDCTQRITLRTKYRLVSNY